MGARQETRELLERLSRNCRSIGATIEASRLLVLKSQALLDDTTVGSSKSWRFGVLLLAVGSTRSDGGDLTTPDRKVLEYIDQQLQRCARSGGEALAEQMLQQIVALLEADVPISEVTRH